MTNFNVNLIGGYIVALAFVVNIIVQLLKDNIHIPTKALAIIVSMVVTLTGYGVVVSLNYLEFSIINVVLSLLASFIIAYVSMYGFDTFKELWQKFKGGGNIGS